MLCMTTSYKTARQAQICRGSVPIVFSSDLTEPADITQVGLAFAKEVG